jgi:hypothetical protein
MEIPVDILWPRCGLLATSQQRPPFPAVAVAVAAGLPIYELTREGLLRGPDVFRLCSFWNACVGTPLQ